MGSAISFSRAKRCSRCISAMDSPPPDTAMAHGGGAWSAMACANAASSPPATGEDLLAAGRLAEARRAGEGLRRRAGIFRLDETKRGAAFRFLAHRHEGLGQLEHSVGRAR